MSLLHCRDWYPVVLRRSFRFAPGALQHTFEAGDLGGLEGRFHRPGEKESLFEVGLRLGGLLQEHQDIREQDVGIDRVGGERVCLPGFLQGFR